MVKRFIAEKYPLVATKTKKPPPLRGKVERFLPHACCLRADGGSRGLDLNARAAFLCRTFYIIK